MVGTIVTAALLAVVIATASAGLAAAEDHDPGTGGDGPLRGRAVDGWAEADGGTLGFVPVSETYIWCVIDAGSLRVPNPVEACEGIG